MTLGGIIRIALVLGWLSLVSVHVLRHALPGLGVAERKDFATTLATQIDRSLTYAVRSEGRELGRCVLGFARADAGYVLSTSLDLVGLPGTSAFPTALTGNAPSGGLRATAEQHFDDRLRLTRLRGDGEIFGLAIGIEAGVDHRGLTGSVRMAGVERPLHVAELGDAADQGFAFAFSLPPGLVVGEQFRTTVTDIDWSLAPRRVVAVFTVEERETIATAAGDLDALRVSMVQDGKPAGTLWCDADGTVYRLAMARAAVTLELSSIMHAGAGRIWPPAAVPR